MPINKESFYRNNENWDFFDEEFLNTPEDNFAYQDKWAENVEKQWHSQRPSQDQGQGQGQGQGQLQGQSVGQAQGQALGQDFSGVVQHQYITVNYGGSRPHRRQPLRNYKDEKGNQYMNFYDNMYEEDYEEDLFPEDASVYGEAPVENAEVPTVKKASAQVPAVRRPNYPAGNYYDYGYGYDYGYNYGYNYGYGDDWWLVILLLFFCGGCGLGFGGFFF